jgi:hypothetical protein
MPAITREDDAFGVIGLNVVAAFLKDNPPETINNPPVPRL